MKIIVSKGGGLLNVCFKTMLLEYSKHHGMDAFVFCMLIFGSQCFCYDTQQIFRAL